jgi:hypothetical protein
MRLAESVKRPAAAQSASFGTSGFVRAVMGGRKSRIHAGFRSARIRGRLSDAGPQRGPAVKSRSQPHWAKCKRSLNGKVLGAANEALL